MTASVRLFRIEARRSLGLLLVIPFAAAVWAIVMFTTPTASGKLVLWAHVSDAVADGAGLVGTALAGIAAWAAGRNRRAKAEELLSTTPLPPPGRELAGWAAVAGWGVLGIALGTGAVMAQAALKATWGGPHFSPIAIGILITTVSATSGYAAGTWFPGRFTAPLSSVAVFLILLIPSVFHHPIQNLAFLSSSYDSEFWRIQPDLSVPQAGLLLGLLALAMGVIVLRHRRSMPAVAFTGVAAAVSLAFVVTLLGSEPQNGVERVAYEPLCAQGTLEVCIHPAYSAVQDETVDVLRRLTAPLAGIPGAPTKAEQVPSAEYWGPTADGVLRFELNEAMTFLGGGNNSLASQVSGALTYGHACCDEAQEVIRGWLLEQAGVPSDICQQGVGGGVCTGVSQRYLPDIERFAALEPSVREAWLYDNYAALINGELTLQDLPQ